MEIPITSLQPGQSGRLAAAQADLPISPRLMALGFVPGTVITLVRRAPFGDPVELELRGYRLCLRLEQLEMLRVQPEPDPS